MKLIEIILIYLSCKEIGKVAETIIYFILMIVFIIFICILCGLMQLFS
jgi:hypothetical protein